MTGPTRPRTPTTPPTSHEQAGRAGEVAPAPAARRLDQPPSDRFGTGQEPAPLPDDVARDGSPTRAVAMGIVGAAIGAGIFFVLAVGFSFSAGLLVVAIFTGRFTGLFVRAGAAGSLSSPARAAVAMLIFLVALTVAVAATWLAAGLEGGVLPIGDYLDQTYGIPLISFEFMLGTLMAWWSAR